MGEVLVPRLNDIRANSRPVVVLYDGDPDDRDIPDIGAVAGRLYDEFHTHVGDGGMTFATAQRQSWYYPSVPGGNLTNAKGRPFDTFVFPDSVYDGENSHFTQSNQLAAYPGYSQIYIGASGLIGAGQMVDYVNRVPKGGAVNVSIIRALNYGALDQQIGDKLAATVDEAKRRKFQAMLEQRRRIYGPHWGNDGRFDDSFRQEIRRPDEGREIVALWKSAEEVDIVNCRKIDLNTPEYDQKFDEAEYYTKTEPIRARQVAPGQTEVVRVKSGATSDTAHGDEWICTSIGGEEYKGPKDFYGIYDPDPARPGWFKPKYDPRKLIPLNEDVIFTTPWGEPQAIQKGGFLTKREIKDDKGRPTGQFERYGISAKDAADMKPISTIA